jgi:hypothetical protein
MHILVISLLTILAGTLLLAKFKKENLGKPFPCISWFFIIVGLLLFLGAIALGICRMKHHGCCGEPGFKHEMMMKGGGHGMMGDRCCPMPGMRPGMHPMPGHPMPGCMPVDSTMKCCPQKAKCDTAKAGCPKK